MKKANLGDIFLYQCKLVEVVAINEGHRSIVFQEINPKRCECCGEIKQYDIIESSPLFQENSEPIQTIKQD